MSIKIVVNSRIIKNLYLVAIFSILVLLDAKKNKA